MSENTSTRYVSRAVLVALLTLAATSAMAQTIQGSATFRERMALPPAAVFEASLEDVSRAGARAEIIGRTRLTSPGNPPIAFTITYDPAKIQSNRRYSVRARILVDDKLLFTTDTATPVITGGNPTSVSLMLRSVGAQTPPPAAGGKPSNSTPSSPLAGTSWQLVKFQSMDDTTLTPKDGTNYTIEFADGGQLIARVDCNRGRGTWKSPGPSQLEFGPLALTRAQCPPGSMHDQIARNWEFIRSYVIRDGHLFLAVKADSGIYEFEPIRNHSKGLRPSDSPTRALARRFDGSLRSRGSLARSLAALLPALRFMR